MGAAADRVAGCIFSTAGPCKSTVQYPAPPLPLPWLFPGAPLLDMDSGHTACPFSSIAMRRYSIAAVRRQSTRSRYILQYTTDWTVHGSIVVRSRDRLTASAHLTHGSEPHVRFLIDGYSVSCLFIRSTPVVRPVSYIEQRTDTVFMFFLISLVDRNEDCTIAPKKISERGLSSAEE